MNSPISLNGSVEYWQACLSGSSSSLPFSIRPACKSDLGKLADLLVECFYARPGWLGYLLPLLRLGIYEDLRCRFNAGLSHYVCLVAVDRSPTSGSSDNTDCSSECLLGTVELGLRPQQSWWPWCPQSPYLSNLAVRSQHRRQGIAQQLLITCEQTAQRWGFQDLYLHVLENNNPARQLYYKSGYRLERIDTHWGAWLLQQPSQFFLRKKLTPRTAETAATEQIGIL